MNKLVIICFYVIGVGAELVCDAIEADAPDGKIFE